MVSTHIGSDGIDTRDIALAFPELLGEAIGNDRPGRLGRRRIADGGAQVEDGDGGPRALRLHSNATARQNRLDRLRFFRAIVCSNTNACLVAPVL